MPSIVKKILNKPVLAIGSPTELPFGISAATILTLDPTQILVLNGIIAEVNYFVAADANAENILDVKGLENFDASGNPFGVFPATFAGAELLYYFHESFGTRTLRLYEVFSQPLVYKNISVASFVASLSTFAAVPAGSASIMLEVLGEILNVEDLQRFPYRYR